MLKEMLFSTALIGGSGSDIDVEELNVTENGEYYDGDNVAYSPVNVNVPQTTVTSLSATENKTYTAPTGTAYSPVTVNVPQTTVTSLTATENKTYTAPAGTAYSPVIVNVSGGAYTFISSNEYEIQTSSTSTISIDSIPIPVPQSPCYVYISIRDKAGARNGSFLGSDNFFIVKPDGTFSTATRFGYKYAQDAYSCGMMSTGYGVYIDSIDSSNNALLKAKYSASSSLGINGTFKVDAYYLDYLASQNPFS